jgi:LmbE family N-acetylglucosaminyl deacetylase
MRGHATWSEAMSLFAITFPILPGKTPAWRSFIGELTGARKTEFEASRRALGVRERTFLQPTPMGDFVIVTLEGDDPASAFGKFGQGNDDFTTWFKAQVQDVHGMDLAAPPPGPLPELVADTGAR